MSKFFDRFLYEHLAHLKDGTGDETNGRHIVPELVVRLCAGKTTPSVLDVGAGYGRDLLTVKKAIPGAVLSAVEGFPQAVEHLRKTGFHVASIDLERQALPFLDESFDVVLCNQVLEHTKEIFWVVSELTRVCKVGGKLALGVPNLGSLHNRVSLLLGRQPPAIHVFGPHVRGFTNEGLIDFLEAGNVLKVESVAGGNFYPFSPSISRPLARWLPGMAVSSFFGVRKLNNASFLEVLKSPRGGVLADTPYFRGA